jgi:ClpP class serine protease
MFGMPNWHDVLNELQQMGSPFDVLRRKYIKELHKHTGRNVICYYSGWLQKKGIEEVAVNDSDKNGLMTVITGLNVKKGLDLVLHTPGGDTAATESIVDYIYKEFGNDIRCFVPQMAMSAGTMMACACKEIWMGKQSSLGPIDPQYRGLPAHAIIEEFKRVVFDIQKDPRLIPVWQPIIAKYEHGKFPACKYSFSIPA